MTESAKGYAKINLHLDVTGIMDDGYHAVRTVMQSISLCDDVSVTLTTDGTFTCECDANAVPTDEKNIALRAAKLYCQTVNTVCGVYVNIKKRIPIAAGLAGGSADAAATLVALDKIFNCKLGEEKLRRLAAKLGADVPFCVSCGTRLADGRGDTLKSFPSLRDDLIVLVACGGEGVSTPWAYRVLDEYYDCFRNYEEKSTCELKKVISLGDPKSISESLFNIFEIPISEQRPAVRELKNIMLSSGALASMMSGSGPSVFGIFGSWEQLRAAEGKIAQRGFFVCSAYPTPARYNQ